MDCKSCKTKTDVPYIAYESAMARNERTVKRLVAVIIVMAVILCATVGGFLWYLSQYDFTGFSQDGEGVNIVNKIEDIIREAPDEQTRQELQRIAGRMRNG